MSTKIENKQKDQPLKESTTNKIKDSKVDVFIDILTISIFFDGTGNNRFNVESALNDPSLKEKGESYKSYYSNVALLYLATYDTDSHKRVYIQGAGTSDGNKDYNPGLGFAWGRTGLIARMSEACEKVEACREATDAKRLLINLYGFSRGAAFARHFCHYLKGRAVLSTSPIAITEAAISSKIEMSRITDNSRYHGIQVDAKNIKINFIGLFDTVSSFDLGHYGNVKEYHLDICKKKYDIRYIVHFTSQNEYRKHFPLTSISAAITENIGFECSFPGAHSDIGGGYPAKVINEKKFLSYKKLDDVKKNSNVIYWRWFKNMGYYSANQFSEGEVTHQYVTRNQIFRKAFPVMYGTRQIKPQYQFILAEIMRDIVQKETNIAFHKNPDINEAVAEMKAIPILKAFRDVAHAYVLSDYKQAGQYQVPLLDPVQMQSIYNQYIHNSLDFEEKSTLVNPDVGTPDNKEKGGRIFTRNYMSPVRTKVTRGYKYK